MVITKCVYCGKDFQKKKGTKLCPDCQKLDIYVYCTKCGKKFKLNIRDAWDYKLGRKRKHYYCSKKCMPDYSKTLLKKEFKCTCIHCGKEFISHHNQSKWCSECDKIRVTLNCPICGKEFTLNKTKSRAYLLNKCVQPTCSYKCASDLYFKEHPEELEKRRQQLIAYNKSEKGRANSSRVGELATGLKARHLSCHFFCNNLSLSFLRN